MSYTPGPWVVHADGVLVLGAGLPGDRQAIVDCETSASPNLRHAERRANARLIAAAPELLAALKAIVEHEQIDGTGIRYVFDWGSPLGKQARAAIVKAGGESV